MLEFIEASPAIDREGFYVCKCHTCGRRFDSPDSEPVEEIVCPNCDDGENNGKNIEILAVSHD